MKGNVDHITQLSVFTFHDCLYFPFNPNPFSRAFISADKDFDGQVSEDEFEGMISAANDFPKKFGFEWWAGSGKDQFKAIDENGDGGISFDEWLNFAYTHYQSQKLPVAFDKEEKDAFVNSCKDSANTGSESYKKVYWFSWKCFQAADADRDGQVSNSEFATMINVATSGQKRWVTDLEKVVNRPQAENSELNNVPKIA